MHGSQEGKSRYIGPALLAVRAAVARCAAPATTPRRCSFSQWSRGSSVHPCR